MEVPMTSEQIFEDIQKLIELVKDEKGFRDKVTKDSRFIEDLSMSIAETYRVARLSEKTFFFVMESTELTAIKTVQDLLNLIEKKKN